MIEVIDIGEHTASIDELDNVEVIKMRQYFTMQYACICLSSVLIQNL